MSVLLYENFSPLKIVNVRLYGYKVPKGLPMWGEATLEDGVPTLRVEVSGIAWEQTGFISGGIRVLTSTLNIGKYTVTISALDEAKIVRDTRTLQIEVLDPTTLTSKGHAYIPDWQGEATSTSLRVFALNDADFQDIYYIKIGTAKGGAQQIGCGLTFGTPLVISGIPISEDMEYEVWSNVTNQLIYKETVRGIYFPAPTPTPTPPPPAPLPSPSKKVLEGSLYAMPFIGALAIGIDELRERRKR